MKCEGEKCEDATGDTAAEGNCELGDERGLGFRLSRPSLSIGKERREKAKKGRQQADERTGFGCPVQGMGDTAPVPLVSQGERFDDPSADYVVDIERNGSKEGPGNADKFFYQVV